METPAPPFEPADWDDDRSDSPMDDPTASDAVRFAGCSMQIELDQLGVQAS